MQFEHQMKQLIINRDKWCRGNINTEKGTALLDEAGMMCCLGFHCEQIDGISHDDILEKGVPFEIGKLLHGPLDHFLETGNLQTR